MQPPPSTWHERVNSRLLSFQGTLGRHGNGQTVFQRGEGRGGGGEEKKSPPKLPPHFFLSPSFRTHTHTHNRTHWATHPHTHTHTHTLTHLHTHTHTRTLQCDFLTDQKAISLMNRCFFFLASSFGAKTFSKSLFEMLIVHSLHSYWHINLCRKL